ncbi:hypothetical protein [Marinobacter nauticus]|uniref:Uncharacterized protein n=1 Tax=Marinobacter nauticus TaxID=2743 RepID=A0A1M2UU20_MARNT|nr:hypothetical protein [Marinobacter nauticus]OJS98807.1 hypothetical protein BEE62_01035 [Marinobacter nauticus]
MDTDKTDRKLKGGQLLVLAAVIGALAWFAMQHPKEADWVFYAPDGEIIEGGIYKRCLNRVSNEWGRCHYINYLMRGTRWSSTISLPDLGENPDGVMVVEYSDGRCRISAKHGDDRVRVLIERGQVLSGTARLSRQESKTVAFTEFMVPLQQWGDSAFTGYKTEFHKREDDALIYGSSENLVSWRKRGPVVPFELDDERQSRRAGYKFSDEHDQILGYNELLVEGFKIPYRDEPLEDESAVKSFEKSVIADAFAWRDEVLADFSSKSGLEIPLNCDVLRSI